MSIHNNVKNLLNDLPPGVDLVAAVKGRLLADIQVAVDAGIAIIGENYVQEAENLYATIGSRVQWHFIGHLQKNKVKAAVTLFDMIETVDSTALATEIDKRCLAFGKTMPVLIEVNSGREPQKHGVLPEEVVTIIREIVRLRQVKVMGLMTMGPALPDPARLRSYFSETKQLFEELRRLSIPGTEMKYLSMGMSDSYRIAIEVGANIVRIGTKIFEG